MARQQRLLYPDALYHVISRGIDRRAIFEDDGDRHGFLAGLGLGVERYGVIVHSYVLLDNHFHALVQTPRANLPAFMRHVKGCHSQAFNRRHGRVGYLFQGRYKAALVETGPYLMEVIRYIALNPLRTTPPSCERPEDWLYGSYRAVLGLARAPSWLTTRWTLALFADDRGTARARLKRFVDDAIPSLPDLAIRSGVYLGRDGFIAESSAHLEPNAEIPREQWQPLRPSLAAILVSPIDDAIARAYRQHGYTLRQIGEHLGRHPATISRRLRRAEQLRRL